MGQTGLDNVLERHAGLFQDILEVLELVRYARSCCQSLKLYLENLASPVLHLERGQLSPRMAIVVLTVPSTIWLSLVCPTEPEV